MKRKDREGIKFSFEETIANNILDASKQVPMYRLGNG